jgi:hypothetical protein
MDGIARFIPYPFVQTVDIPGNANLPIGVLRGAPRQSGDWRSQRRCVPSMKYSIRIGHGSPALSFPFETLKMQAWQIPTSQS